MYYTMLLQATALAHWRCSGEKTFLRKMQEARLMPQQGWYVLFKQISYGLLSSRHSARLISAQSWKYLAENIDRHVHYHVPFSPSRFCPRYSKKKGAPEGAARSEALPPAMSAASGGGEVR
jgi:hypothetical protein